ncbi:MAG: hypothetical protein KME08_14920 [Aphanothece sp. CMT-3BRIN-NPC111]|nr:hypothetical protein [Aphanothece sp. CMT-3BRIN-NPC111]
MEQVLTLGKQTRSPPLNRLSRQTADRRGVTLGFGWLKLAQGHGDTKTRGMLDTNG